jgi:uncharacterized membrane protein YgcG
MRRNKKIAGVTVRFSGKALILGATLAILFSPFGGLFSTPTVYAANICGRIIGDSIDTNDHKPLNSDGSCPEGFRAFPEENKGRGLITIAKEGSNACNSLPSCIAEVVYWFTAGLGGAAAYLAAWVLSIATALSLSSTAYALDFITDGWTIVRDLANMLFVLILVYLALTIMFRADTHDTAKKLAWVIAIALVINFSFFFTRVVIDAGNLLAVQFYNSIEAPGIGQSMKDAELPGSEITTITGEGGATKDLTFSVMQGIGIQKIMSNDAFNAFQDRNSGIGGFVAELLLLIFIYIAVGAMFFMLAAAFFTVAIKFIIRIAVLWLLIIASPLAFVANTLQEGKHWYKQWQSALISHAFYPAFFLFVFYILTLFMANLTNNGTETVIGQAFGATSPTDPSDSFSYIISVIASVVVRMGFVLALLYIGLKASEAMGVMGAHFADNLGKKITGFAGGLPLRGTLAGAAAGSRFAIGGSALRASRSEFVQNLRADTMIGRAIKGGLRGLSRASYDARGIPGASTALSGGGLLDIGKAGGKGGYAKKMEERAKYIEAEAKALKADDVDIRNAQERYIANFEYGGQTGREAYDARMAELERSKADAKRDQLAAEATGNKAQADAAKKHQAELDKEIKKLQEGGKTQVEADAKARIKRFAERIGGRNFRNLGMPSRGSIEGAAKALKLVSEKSNKDKLAEAAAALAKEGGEGGGDDHGGGGGSGGGGGKGKGGGGGGDTKATGKDTAGKADSHGAHASMAEHTEKMVTAFERMAQRLERTVEHGFQGLGEQLHQESKRAESQTLRANSAKIGEAAAATRPVAAVPTGGNVAVPPKPPAQTRLNTPPVPPKPGANDNFPQNRDKAA